MASKPWTTEDIALLTRHYKEEGGKALLVKLLNRTPRAISNKAAEYDLTKTTSKYDQYYEKIREMLINGLTDYKIGKALGICSKGVTRIRLKIEKMKNQLYEAHKEQSQETVNTNPYIEEELNVDVELVCEVEDAYKEHTKTQEEQADHNKDTTIEVINDTEPTSPECSSQGDSL